MAEAPSSTSAGSGGRLASLPGWARSLLAGGRVARLATVDAEGQPSVVAVCYALTGDRLYSPIDGKPKKTPRLRRLRDLEANPRVALVVDRWEEDWRKLAWVSVRGRGRVLEERGADEDERREAIGALRAKYTQYGTTEAGEGGAPLADSATVIRVDVEAARCWRFAGEEEA